MFRKSYLVVSLLILMNQSALAQDSCESKIDSIYTTYVESRTNDLNRRMDVACRSVFGMWQNTCDEYLHTPLYENALIEAQNKTYALEEFKTELEWAGNLIKGSELKIKKWGKLASGKVKTKQQKEIQKELFGYFQNPRFFNAYILNDLLDSVGRDCKMLQQNGFSCTQRIPVENYQAYIQKILKNLSNEETEQVGYEQIGDFRKVAEYADFVPLYEASHLTIKPSNAQDLNLVIGIPVKCQSGFATDSEFETFFNRMKSVIENFWKGDYVTPAGETVHIQTKLVWSDETSSTSIQVVNPKDSNMMLFGGEAGFSVKDNSIMFNTKTVENNNFGENSIIAHEFGHVLGFDDQYFLVTVDPKTCNVSNYAKNNEIMGAKKGVDVNPKISPEEIKFLYNTYNTDLGFKRRYIMKNFIKQFEEIQKDRGIEPLK